MPCDHACHRLIAHAIFELHMPSSHTRPSTQPHTRACIRARPRWARAPLSSNHKQLCVVSARAQPRTRGRARACKLIDVQCEQIVLLLLCDAGHSSDRGADGGVQDRVRTRDVSRGDAEHERSQGGACGAKDNRASLHTLAATFPWAARNGTVDFARLSGGVCAASSVVCSLARFCTR